VSGLSEYCSDHIQQVVIQSFSWMAERHAEIGNREFA
jgi:hypothetical protein